MESERRRWLRLRGLACGAALGLLGAYLGFVFVVLAHRRGVQAFGRQSAEVLGSSTSTTGTGTGTASTDTGTGTGTGTGAGADAGAGNATRLEWAGRLPDVGFDLVGAWGVPEATEVWVAVGGLVTLVRFCFDERGPTVLRRWFVVAGAVSLARGMSRWLTVRPPTAGDCHFHDDDADDASAAWVALLVFARLASNCVDSLFALHVVHLTLCCMVWLYYLDPAADGGLPARLGVLAYGLCGYFLIISTRAHYTADVMLWALLTALVWTAYHHWILLLRLDSLGLLGVERQLTTGSNFVTRAVLAMEAGSLDLDFVEYRDPSLHGGARMRKGSEDASLEDDPMYDDDDDGAFAFGSNESTHIVFDGTRTAKDAGSDGRYESFANSSATASGKPLP